MADRTFFDVQAPGLDTVMVAFSFAPNGAGSIDDTATKGEGVTDVERSGAGTYLITLNDTYPTLLSAVATLQLATPDDKFCEIGSYSAADKQITVVVWDIDAGGGGAAADVAADDNNRVNVVLFFSNSSA